MISKTFHPSNIRLTHHLLSPQFSGNANADMSRTVLFSIIFLVICDHIIAEDCCDGCKCSYVRVKRGRFYSSPPQRYYSRPPPGMSIKGPYSYTPPPFVNDNGPSYPGIRPYKVSKRPTNDGLGDGDISNLVKHLTKQDLDKILEFAYEKDNTQYSKPPRIERPQFEKPVFKENEIDVQFGYQEPSEKPYEVDFNKYVKHITDSVPEKILSHDVYENPNIRIKSADSTQNVPIYTKHNKIKNIPLSQTYVEQSIPNNSAPKSVLDYQVFDDIEKFHTKTDMQEFQANRQMYAPVYGIENISPSQNDLNSNKHISKANSETRNPYYIDSNEEESLPKPLNMRDEDFEISHTNNVPTVVKAESVSYEVEDFGNLPLMNYDSKLHSVSSYHVPHYTVTTSSRQPTSYGSSSSTSLLPSPSAAFIKAPPLEPAPPKSVAAKQSDAHLKAIKIWTHRSKGTAYTLHNDGTLSLETPGWPKYG